MKLTVVLKSGQKFNIDHIKKDEVKRLKDAIYGNDTWARSVWHNAANNGISSYILISEIAAIIAEDEFASEGAEKL